MRVNARQAAQQAQDHLRAGKPRDALAITRQLVTAFPALPAANLLHAETLTRLALARTDLPFIDTALSAKLPPNTPDAALLRARLCRLTDQPDDAHPILDPLIADPATPARARSALRFAKAQCLESTERYDEAFAEYTRANHDLNTTFDPDRLRRQTDAAIAALATARPDTDTPCEILLIVGMPRSGTSLTEQILAAHPQVGAAGESQALPWFARGIADRNTGEPTDDPDRLAAAGNAYIAELRAAATRDRAQVFTDKNPMNLFLLAHAARCLPGLRVLRLRRSPIDVCLSCYTAPLGPDHAYATDPAHCAAYYAAADRVLNAAERALGPMVRTVDYEALVRDPEPAVRGMLEHAGLDFDERCMHPERSGRVVQTSSRDQVTSSISDRSVGRWERFAAHLGPLRAALEQAGYPAPDSGGA